MRIESKTILLEDKHNAPSLSSSGRFAFIPKLGIIETSTGDLQFAEDSLVSCHFAQDDTFATFIYGNSLDTSGAATCHLLSNPTNPFYEFTWVCDVNQFVTISDCGELVLVQCATEHLPAIFSAVDPTTGSERVLFSAREGAALYQDVLGLYTFDGEDGSDEVYPNKIRSFQDGAVLCECPASIGMSLAGRVYVRAIPFYVAEEVLSVVRDGWKKIRAMFPDPQPNKIDQCLVLKDFNGRAIAVERIPMGAIRKARASPDGKWMGIDVMSIAPSGEKGVVLDTTTGERVYEDDQLSSTLFCPKHFARVFPGHLAFISMETFKVEQTVELDAHFRRAFQSTDGRTLLLCNAVRDEPKCQIIRIL